MLRMTVRFFVLIAFGFLLTSPTANAWSAAGHRIVANIAYDQMSKEARAKVVALLRKHPRFREEMANRMPANVKSAPVDVQDRWIFLQASIWPDLIRRNPQYDRPTWHYVNLPKFLSELDQKALQNELTTNVKTDLPKDLPNEDVPRAALNAVQAIKFAIARLNDEKSSDEIKAIYLCWLMHVVGDLHQPLHSTSLYSRGRFFEAGGDRGGNSIPVTQKRNLHWFWDALLGEDVTLNEVRRRAFDVLSNEKLKALGETAKKDLQPETIMRESHALADAFVYPPDVLKEVERKESNPRERLSSIKLPAEYLTAAGAKAQERAAQAGFRLGALLEQVIK